MTSRRWWWAGGVLLAGLAVVLVARRPPPPAPSPSADTGALEREVAGLRGQVRALAARQPPALAQAAPAATRAADPPIGREARAADLRQRIQEARQTMERQLQHEGRDQAVTSRVGQQVEALYASRPFAGTRLESVECGATMCKVASRHESYEAQRRFSLEASLHPPFDTEVFYARGETDPTTTTLYVALPGRSLPRPNGLPGGRAQVTPTSM